ncbi:pilV, Shufflon protein [Enterobacter cloacae]|nr:pilV, Shufflon protein [Enterobacter cloacae]
MRLAQYFPVNPVCGRVPEKLIIRPVNGYQRQMQMMTLLVIKQPPVLQDGLFSLYVGFRFHPMLTMNM